jgi:FMN reductase
MPSTTDTFKVLGVAGSTRGQSYSTRALKIALEHAKKQGAEVRLLELGMTELPLYNPNAEASKEVEQAAEAVAWADAFILASPDYHGSISGALKNFLDYFFEEFAGKLFGYIVASHEKGLTVMEQMRTAVRQCYGWSMPYGLSVGGEQDFAGSEISNARLAKRVGMMSRDLVVYGRLLRAQFASDVTGADEDTFAAHYRP